jgi:hypothetical protein
MVLAEGCTNGSRLCAVVSDIDHDNELSERGGILVDLAHCDKGNDQLLGYQELLNFDPTMSVSGDKILTQSDSTSASILVQGGYGPFAVETTYRLDLFRPNRLQISTIITRRGEEGALVAVAGGMNNIESPFTLSFDRKRRSPGFLHRQFVGKGPSELSKAATPADLVVAVGARGLNADISYGQRVVSAKLIRSNGRQRTLPHFFFSDEMATTLNFFSRPF